MQVKKPGPLPAKEGVGPSCVALPPGSWCTLIDFLVSRFPHIPNTEWQARMLRGDVVDASGCVLLPDHPYCAHSKIYYYRSLPSEAVIPFDEVVLYQDDYIVVVDKPHFLPVTPSGRYLQESLLVRLKRKLGIDTLSPAHRIDRDTAGLVLFTIQPDTRNRYQALFRERAVDKYYEAIAHWQPDLALPMIYRTRLVEGGSFMTMQQVKGEPNSETAIDVLEVNGTWARYGLRPVTGKRHQLRVHMMALGMPILNDGIYPYLTPELDPPDYRKPLQLLAKSLAFIDPISGQAWQFESQRSLSI